MLQNQKLTARICIAGLLLLFTFQIHAQAISGTVTDEKTGEPMQGATVVLKDSGKKQYVQLDGKFSFKSLAPGTYTIEISFTNYSTHEETVTVSAGKTSIINVLMTAETVELSNVVVNSGANASGEKNIRALEKNSNQLVNIVSAKNMQLLPDITVANVLQRVSGVTVEKSSSGEARYPIIRGMEKRYINTLINGIKIPSPDNKNRFIPLDLFPSELLERLEVSKSLTPSLEGDAVGGTINLVMKDAPQTRIFQVNAAMGYNNSFGKEDYLKFFRKTIKQLSPAEIHGSNYVAVPEEFPVGHLNYVKLFTPLNTTMGFTYGNRFGETKKLGFIVSGSYQNIFRGTTSNFFLPNSQPGLNNIPLFSDLQLRQYSVQSQRMGISGKFDYQINAANKISFTNTYVRLNDYQTRIIYDTVTLNSLVNNSQRSTWQYQSIYNTTLQGVHKITGNTLKADWSLVYSLANNHIPDQSQFTHQYAIVSTSLTTDKLQSMTRIWTHNSDKDYSAYLNLTENFKIGDRKFEIREGGMYRKKTRDNFYNSYSLNPILNEVFTDINHATFIFNPTSAGIPSLNGNNYTFDEKVSAGYVQGKLDITNKIELLGGVRVEHTNQSYVTALSKDVDARSGTIKYTDVLPSAQLKIAVTKNQNIRLAYYRALARPGFAELIPDGPDGEFFKEIGDPKNLEHTIADNYDLRYELYSAKADQVLLGVFYKNIQDPIEISAIKPLNVNSLYLEPVNTGNATNYGFEAVITKYFGNFGVAANYTYTKSRITNDSLIYSSRNDAGLIVSKRVSETRPLQGQSDHIGNISLLYKNPKLGLDLQVAGVYTGKRINFISPYLGLNYWQSPTTQLDCSFEKRILKGFTVYGKFTNLTNAPYQLYLKQSYNEYLKSSGSRALALQTDPDNKIIIQKDFYKTTFLLGLRYKL